MTKRWKLFQAPPTMSAEEAVKSVQRATEGRYGAFIDFLKVDEQGNGGVIRTGDRIPFQDAATEAQARGDSRRALELLKSASSTAMMGRYNEERGYTNRGRRHGARQKVERDQQAIDWCLAHAAETGCKDPYRLAALAHKVGAIPDIETGQQLTRAINRIGPKVKAALAKNT